MMSASSKKHKIETLEDLYEANNRRSETKDMVWQLLDDPNSSEFAKLYHKITPCMICISVITSLLRATEPPVLSGFVSQCFNLWFEILYTVEFMMRLVSAPHKGVFWINFYNQIDLFAALPLVFHIYFYALDENELGCGFFCSAAMCFIPFIRALKTLRRFEELRLIMEASSRAAEGLPVCLFFLFVATLFFASLIYLAESRDNIESLPRAMWLTIVTMTTVGYGDVSPKSTVGSLICSCLVVFSVLYMAMPLGIVGSAFNDVWQDRDVILLRYRVKSKLVQWGYEPSELSALFGLFDSDGNAELDKEEFMKMMAALKVGLSEARVGMLFDLLDESGDGKISDDEFLKALFPEHFFAVDAEAET